MNRLRELLDTPAARLGVNGAIPGGFASPAVAGFRHFAANAMCFWIGRLEDLASSMPIVPEMCRLPFDNCWFEWEFDGEVEACWALQFSGACTILFFARRNNEWSLVSASRSEDFAFSGGAEVHPADGNFYSQHFRWRAVVDAFLTALHCVNVQRAETKPDDKLQRARQKRGKQPLFSYWTLQLDGRHEGGSPLGGTHDSPRVHLRRGHPRQFKPGLYTWVQPHMVGNAYAGMVHKDYAAGRAVKPAAPGGKD